MIVSFHEELLYKDVHPASVTARSDATRSAAYPCPLASATTPGAHRRSKWPEHATWTCHGHYRHIEYTAQRARQWQYAELERRSSNRPEHYLLPLPHAGEALTRGAGTRAGAPRIPDRRSRHLTNSRTYGLRLVQCLLCPVSWTW